MSTKIGFTSAIIKHDQSSEKLSATEAFDDYFNLSGRKCRVISGIQGKEKDFIVKEEYVKNNIPLSILKVVSYLTGIIPLIMLVGKAISRAQYNFYSIEKGATQFQAAIRSHLAQKKLKALLKHQKKAKITLQEIVAKEKMQLFNMEHALSTMQQKYPPLLKSPGNMGELNFYLGNILLHIGKSTKIVKKLEDLFSDDGIQKNASETEKLRIKTKRITEYLSSKEYQEYLKSSIEVALTVDSIDKLLSESKHNEFLATSGFKNFHPFTDLANHTVNHPMMLRELKGHFEKLGFQKEVDLLPQVFSKEENFIQDTYPKANTLGPIGKKQAALMKAKFAMSRTKDRKSEMKALRSEIHLLKERAKNSKSIAELGTDFNERYVRVTAALAKHGFKRDDRKEELNAMERLKRSLSKTQKFIDKKFEEAHLSSKIAKVQYLFLNGREFQSDKGATGTLKLKDVNGKLLGVFKPGADAVDTAMKIKIFVKQNFGAQLSLLKNDKLVQPYGEVAAYHLDRFFGFDVVPPSRMMMLGGKAGAFQMAAQIYKKAKDYSSKKSTEISLGLKEAKEVKVDLDKDVFTLEELDKFQRFALHDFLIGNLDAHSENWFVETVEGTVKDVIGIDKANCLITGNPTEGAIAGKNQYKWKKRNIAKQEFTLEMKKLMLSITEEKVEEFIASLSEIDGLSTFIDESMKARMLERVKAIQFVAKLADGCTPAHLAEFCTDEKFKVVV